MECDLVLRKYRGFHRVKLAKTCNEIFFNFVFLFLILINFSCSKSNDHEESFDLKNVVREQGADFLVPSQLWDLLIIYDAKEEEFRKLKKVNEDETLKNVSLVYAPISLTLIEKNPQVLTHARIKVEFPKGGGTLDLSKYVGEKKGSFYLKFEHEGLKKASAFGYTFLSNAKKRNVDGQVVGSGCNVFFELGNEFIKKNLDQGITLNTTKNIHSTVLGGRFVFSWFFEKNLYVSQVHFVDSKNPSLFCAENSKTKDSQ